MVLIMRTKMYAHNTTATNTDRKWVLNKSYVVNISPHISVFMTESH